MDIFVTSLFSLIFSAIGVSSYPTYSSDIWQIEKTWIKNNDQYSTNLISKKIGKQCDSNPDEYIVFPQVIHSYQEILVDGKLVSSFGNKTFSIASPFYEKNYISCRILKSARTVEWRASTYSQFFARIKSYPIMSKNPFSQNIFSVTANILAFGSLLVLSIFCLYLFYGKVSNTLTYSISSSAFFLSIYFLNTVNSFFNLSISMGHSHRLADTCLWLGGGLITASYYYDKLLSKKFLFFFTLSISVGLIFIIFGENADIIQFGTTIPMIGWLFCNMNIFFRLLKKFHKSGLDQYILLKGLSVAAFVTAGINDVFSIFGVTNTELVISVGLVIGIFGVAISVNQEIEHTYKERDGLLQNLEQKIKEKTLTLETTLLTLKSTQAELIQSAKLASLGTVSAGIAHEINNSINFVSGAIIPLERKVNALIPEQERKSIEKLFAAIKTGTSLTVDIVKSLRNFTGLNQAEFKEVSILESIQSIQIILKSKLSNIKFETNISKDCIINGNLVGLNQLFMNLITNAIDSLDKSEKTIVIRGFSNSEGVVISIQDNGTGIPENIRKNIFDPFFTTKEIGKGTGLGLHIVSKEVERHQGKILVKSTPGIGTEFLMTFPIAISDQKKAAA